MKILLGHLLEAVRVSSLWESVVTNWARHLRVAAHPMSSVSQRRAMVVSPESISKGVPQEARRLSLLS